MRRLAVLAFTAGLFGPTGPLLSAEPPSAGGSPPASSPQLRDGEVLPAGWRLPDYGASWRGIGANLGSGPVLVPKWEEPAHSRPGLFTRIFAPTFYEPYNPQAPKPGPQPTPESIGIVQVGHKEPVPLPTGHTSGPGVGYVEGGHGVKHAGGAWHKFVGWFCYRQTPVKLGLHPIPHSAPLYTYFPCNSATGCYAPGCSGGATAPCSGPNCAGTIAERIRKPMFGLPGRGVAGAVGSPGAPLGDPGIPGYRFAAPENPAVAGQPTPPAVINSSYRQPYSDPTRPFTPVPR